MILASFGECFPYNLGPRTVCFKHTNLSTLSFGWCSVTSLCSFDPKGGHLVLWTAIWWFSFPRRHHPSALRHPRTLTRGDITRRNLVCIRSPLPGDCSDGLTRARVLSNPMTSIPHTLSDEEREAVEARDRTRWEYGLFLFPAFPTIS